MKRQIFAILVLVVQMTFGQNYKNYCSNKVCNKCRSYLVRNYRDRTDRLWLMCSALARNDKCCRFESGPTLFTVRDKTGSCVNQPDAHVVEVGYKKYEIAECDQSEDPAQISSDILEELGYADVESLNFDEACADDIGDCVLVSDAIQQLKDEAGQVERLFDTDIRNGSCEIRMNQFESCAVVRQQEMQKSLKEGGVWFLGIAFCAVLVALVVVMIKYKKRETERLKFHQDNRRASTLADVVDNKKSLLSSNKKAEFVSYDNEMS